MYNVQWHPSVYRLCSCYGDSVSGAAPGVAGQTKVGMAALHTATAETFTHSYNNNIPPCFQEEGGTFFHELCSTLLKLIISLFEMFCRQFLHCPRYVGSTAHCFNTGV